MRRSLTLATLAAVTGAILAASAPGAVAQSCNPVPGPQRCQNKFPPGQVINDIVPGAGGPVACPGTAANTVQIDLFYFSSQGMTYQCTSKVACSAFAPGHPYREAFC